MNINPYIELFSRAVIKRDKAFYGFETAEMTKAYQLYRSCILDIAAPSAYRYTESDFTDLGLSEDIAAECLTNIFEIQSIIKDTAILTKLLENKRKEVINSYVEKNNYVRMLAGYPRYEDTTSYTVGEVIKTPINGVRMDVQISSLNVYEIKILKNKGSLKTIQEYYLKDFLYYIDRRASFFSIRESENYSLLYNEVTTVNKDIAIVFAENYEKAKMFHLRVLENVIYYDYITNYDVLVMQYILLHAITMTIIDTKYDNYAIDFEDKEFITAILESNGLSYLELPAVYMEPLIYNIKQLNMKKGTRQVMIDIQKIFDLSNVYRYILFRKPTGIPFDENTSIKDRYDLYFVQVPIHEKNVIPYLEDDGCHIKYSDMVMDDEYWGEYGDNLYDEVIAQEFNYYETKFISIERMFEITRNTFDFTMLTRTIMNNKQLTNNYTLTHKRGVWFHFNLFEGFIYLTILTIKIKGFNDIIPDTIDSVSYVMGLDPNKDFTEHKKTIVRYFSKPEYEELLSRFLKIENIDDIYEFMNVLVTNRQAVYALQQAMIECEDHKEYDFLNKIHDSITIVKTIKENYVDVNGNQVTSYEAYLKSNNDPLYQAFYALASETEYREEFIYIISLMEKVMNPTEDYEVNSVLECMDVYKNEYGEAIDGELKKLLSFYKHLLTDIKDFSTLFKFDSLLYANRTFMDVHTNETQQIRSHSNNSIEINNEKYEVIELSGSQTFTSTICIDDEGVENL